MFSPFASASASAASEMPPSRPALSQFLQIVVPKRPVLATALKCIEDRDETVELTSLLLRRADMELLIAAFNALPVGCNMQAHYKWDFYQSSE